MVANHPEYPQHIAIIMDGNGRWASKRFLPKKAGHKAGADALDKLSHYASNIGLAHLTVYAFSTENWKRSQQEVEDIMDLLHNYLKTYRKNAEEENVKIHVIGNLGPLKSSLIEEIKDLEHATAHKTGMTLHIAFNYGGRDEIMRGISSIIQQVKDGVFQEEQWGEQLFAQQLDTAGCPDPDLVIRTSGEQRISNFLLWQAAYSEFYFSSKLWPDFKPEDLDEAVAEFQNRKRRFGGR